MYRIILLFSVIIFLGLTGCTNPFASLLAHNPNNPGKHHNPSKAYAFPRSRRANGNRVFIFDPKHKAWAVYNERGKRIRTGKASGGAAYCPDIKRPCRTIIGRFKIISKGGSGCISSSFPIETSGGAPMPYCMHFHPKYAIHGSYDVPNYNASHGCVRVTPTVAKWLNTKFMRIGSTVIIRPY